MTIKEYTIKNIIKSMINEEMGINKDVYKASNDILDILQDKIDSTTNISKLKNNNVWITKGSFTFNFISTNILVKYSSYIFNTWSEYQKYKKENHRAVCDANSLSDGSGYAQMYIVYNKTLDRGYDDSIRDRIQHELDHIFKTIKKGGKLTKSNSLGKIVHDTIHMSNAKKDYESVVIKRASYLLYYSKKYEQDAYANGLFNWLMSHNGPTYSIIEESGLKRNVGKMEKHIKFLKNVYANCDDEFRRKINKYFGISLGAIINKGEIALQRAKKLINRVLWLIKNKRNYSFS